ncbi:MAG: S8 family serine peptidase [Phycisphaerales bacterium]
MTNRHSADSGWRRRNLVTVAGFAVALGTASAFAAGPESGKVGTGGSGGAQVGSGGGVGIDAPRVMRVPQGKGARSFRIEHANAEHSAAEMFVDALRTADSDQAVGGYEFYNRVVVRAASTAAAQAAVTQFGGGINATVSIENLGDHTGATVFQARSVGEAITLAQRLQGMPGVEHVELETKPPRASHGAIPNDTFANLQWHLLNTMDMDADHNIAPVFSSGLNGAGITIGVLEVDGTPFQVNHPELRPNFSESLSMTLDPLVPNPSHGTAVAGLIAAKANGVGMVGVAPNARLIALSNGSTVLETQAHQWKNGITHVKNNSWGPVAYPGAIQVFEGEFFAPFYTPQNLNSGDLFPSSNVGLAIKAGSEHGRANRGTAIVFSAGNDGTGLTIPELGPGNAIALPSLDFQYGDLGTFNVGDVGFWPLATLGPRTEYNGYLNAQGTLAIAAVTDHNVPSGYTTTGTAVFAAAYSAPGFVSSGLQPGRGVYTLDAINDFFSYDPTVFGEGFTSDFGGTSAAAPIASGIIGLIMGARPTLTLRDIRHIIERTAVRVNFDWIHDMNEYFARGGLNASLWEVNGAFQVDGRAVAHSDAVGFGVIDAEAAVALAKVWPGLPKQLVLERERNEDNDDSLPYDIPDATMEDVADMVKEAVPGDTVSVTFCVPYDYIVEEVEVIINATGNSPGDLYIGLISPHGTISPLHMPHVDNLAGMIDDQEAAFIENRFLTYKHWGEPSGGEWTLFFRDYRPNEELEEGDIDEEGTITDAFSFFPTYGNIPTLPGNPDGQEISIQDYIVRIYCYDVGRQNPNVCENRFNSFCPYDLNADGKVTPADLFLFIELWQNFEPVADWDGDGAWTYNDIYLYFIGWTPGFCSFDEGDNGTSGGGGPAHPGDGNSDVRPI